MEIKNRLFPYPVLCGDTDDYISSTEFALEPSITETVHELLFEYDYLISCDSIETLLRNGQAEYVLHIECSSCAFRIALKSKVPHISYRLPKSRVTGEINLVAMIIARVDIPFYSSADLNEDYLGENISFKKGSILAYQNLPSVFISKRTEGLANNESFFSIIKMPSLDPEEIKPLAFNLNDDKIKILVDERTYESYVKYQHSHFVAMAMLVLPALTYMIAEIRDNPDLFEKYIWFQKIKQYYKVQGIDFVSEILLKDDNPVYIAQEMLQNPISHAYRELYALEA